MLLRGVMTFAFFSGDAYIPLLLQTWRGTPATLTGLVFTVTTISWTVATWLQARRIDQWGPYRFVGLGFVCVAVGALITIPAVLPGVPPEITILTWILPGLGMGFMYSAVTLVVLRGAAPGETGSASSALQLSDILGTALGAGIAGAITAYGTRTGGDTLGWALAAVFGMSLVAATFGAIASRRIRLPKPVLEHVDRCGRLATRPRPLAPVPPRRRRSRHHRRSPNPMSAETLRAKIREIPDFPKPGILFYDITTVLKEPAAYKEAIDLMLEPYRGEQIDLVVGMESRGFIFSAPMAYLLDTGLVPVRKLGKLPAETLTVEYALEYGSNTLEIHRDAIVAGQKVLIVDDLLATGGTVKGTIELVERLRGEVVGLAFLVELEFLKGRDRLDGRRVTSVIQY